MDAILLKKCLDNGTFVEFDQSIYEGTNMKAREYPDGSKIYGNSMIVTQADKHGRRYMFNFASCSIIAIYENAKASNGTNFFVFNGLYSPAAIVCLMLTSSLWRKESKEEKDKRMKNGEEVDRSLLPAGPSMLEREHLFALGSVVDLAIVVDLYDVNNKFLRKVDVVEDKPCTVTIRLMNNHYPNSGDQKD
jgi:hypothetical protein